MEWKTININKQNIEAKTGRALLIKMPNNGNYKGYKFWHPAKCVRDGRNSNALSISYNDSFTFKLFKNGNGKYNKFKKIDEIEIDVEEFEEEFDVIDENIRSKEIKNPYETHKPEELDVKPVSVIEELVDYE